MQIGPVVSKTNRAKMNILYLGILTIISTGCIYAQPGITGTVVDRPSGKPLPGIRLFLRDSGTSCISGIDGGFSLTDIQSGEWQLVAKPLGYTSLEMVIQVGSDILELGIIYLEREPPETEPEPIISIAETEFGEEGGVMPGYSLLQAGRDVFLTRTAFDFSQAFFRARGYDSRENRVLLNGFVMNSPLDGRPQWNQWGGLNDVVRNQEISYGLELSDFDFGGLLGTTQIDTSPSLLRPGWRISISRSNRSYTGRVMATHVSQADTKGWSYALSASRRWAREGYIDATLYDAWAAFGSLGYHFNETQSIVLTGLISSNRRGRSAALTEEVTELSGPRYNPYWGWQDGKIRNSRERLLREPMLMLNYKYLWGSSGLQLGASYQKGIKSNSRLGYYNAPNPDPTYYRYLPSFAVNNPGGANFLNAQFSRTAFQKSPQINWESLYRANGAGENPGRATYMLYDDVVQGSQLQFLLLCNIVLGTGLKLDSGIRFLSLRAEYFSRIGDLLGAGFHVDKDPFSNTANDLGGALNKKEGDIFGYSYGATANGLESYFQLRYSRNTWQANAGIQFTNTKYRREGNFINERYPGTSGGTGTPLTYSGFGIKGGLQYHIGGRHWAMLQGTLLQRAPSLQQVFINPRESDAVVSGQMPERLCGLELRYDLRSPVVRGRLGLFYTRMMDLADINFFFSDTGFGSDFVQEVITGLDQLHAGLELGLEYNFTSNIKASAVASVAKYRYASDPQVALYFDTAGNPDELINREGRQDLGPAIFKGEALAAGPQTALSFGVEYHHPSYWWVGATANYMGDSYTHPSVLARTKSFDIDPETGRVFPQATPEKIHELLSRKPIEGLYLLNLTGGKSWLKNGLYFSVFASVSNVFNLLFRSGGYEQSRNGNYGQWAGDQLSGSPSFGTKYWHGYGRTFFLNMAVGF
jgi:hypothetical protein